MDSNINRKDIQLAQVSLEQIIEEVLEQLKPEIEEKGAEVTVDKPLPKATASCDTASICNKYCQKCP